MFELARCIAITSHSRATNCFTKLIPMKPVAPLTKAVLDVILALSFPMAATEKVSIHIRFKIFECQIKIPYITHFFQIDFADPGNPYSGHCLSTRLIMISLMRILVPYVRLVSG